MCKLSWSQQNNNKEYVFLPRVDDIFLSSTWIKNIFQNRFNKWISPDLDKKMDSVKSGFRSRLDHYVYVVMHFGLTNAPTTFLTLLNSLFLDYLGKFAFVFMDDILIYSKDEVEHKQHLKQVFEILREHKLDVKLNKCVFFTSRIINLGHVISDERIFVDPRKVTTIAEWPIPKDKTKVRSFLGLASYYTRFVKEFSKIVVSITNLLKEKNDVIDWTLECELSFQNLKFVLTETSVFTIMDPLKQNIILCIDTNDLAIGVILMRDKKVIAYKSRKVNYAELKYPIHEEELLAVLHSLKVWRHYLLGVKV